MSQLWLTQQRPPCQETSEDLLNATVRRSRAIEAIEKQLAQLEANKKSANISRSSIFALWEQTPNEADPEIQRLQSELQELQDGLAEMEEKFLEVCPPHPLCLCKLTGGHHNYSAKTGNKATPWPLRSLRANAPESVFLNVLTR